MDFAKTKEFVASKFSESIVDTLVEYIKIPNLSPSFDADGRNAVETERVIKLFSQWIEKQELAGSKMEVIHLKDDEGAPRTPILFIEVEAFPAIEGEEVTDTVLLYGHMDKQPPFEGWDEGLGPYTPVIKNGRLYGRGGADDGYAVFGSVTALKNCQLQGVPHQRCVILIEACEESGSPDLPFYIEKLVKDGRMRDVSLVICLDSGTKTYDGLWITTTLRGILMADLTVQTLTSGVHSGDGSGVCADSFRICRKILSALEDANTGKMDDSFSAEVPKYRIDETRRVIEHLAKSDGRGGRSSWDHFPLATNKPMLRNEDSMELELNRSWRPTLTVVGQDGLPSCAKGGNVLRPATSLRLSIRLPPSMAPKDAEAALRNIVDSVHCPEAKVSLSNIFGSPGWDSPEHQIWLQRSLEGNAFKVFGNPALCMGEGGSIPFMGMLADMFPAAQFVVTGVLGPDSNAHGPNEFLDLDYCQNVICVISHVLADHQKRRSLPSEEWSLKAGKKADMDSSLSRVDGAAEDKLVAEKKVGM